MLSNFSIASGDDLDKPFQIDAADGISLVGASIAWRVYDQTSGSVSSLVPIIVKSTDSPDGGISIPTSPAADTISLLGNYYHSAQVVDSGGKVTTVFSGIMTVTASPINANLEGSSP